MLNKFAIFLSFYSRKISSIIFGGYLVLIVILIGSIYDNQLPVIYYNIFYFLLGLFIGMNLMVVIIKYLNKKDIGDFNHPNPQHR